MSRGLIAGACLQGVQRGARYLRVAGTRALPTPHRKCDSAPEATGVAGHRQNGMIPMTPAVNLARKLGIAHVVHEYDHDPGSDSYGLEAADKLQIAPPRVFKTLVVSLDGREFAVGVMPVSAMLSMKLIAKAAGARRAVMAEKSAVERATGYVLGGVSPLGQRRKLRTFIDSSAREYPTVYVSAGRRGLEMELAPEDLRQSTGGRYADICQ